MIYKRVLSLDGGGIRGVIPARILTEIELRAKKPVHKLFDLIVGTSTGGILAIGLSAPPTQSQPDHYSAESLLDLYVQRGAEIFERSFWSLGGLRDERYDEEPMERILKKMLGNRQLRNTSPDIIVTSYDIENRRPYLFKSTKARQRGEGRNHLLRHVARATSAAPTYFEPLLLDRTKWSGERNNRRALIDGGVFANNPSMIALSEALSSGADQNKIVLCAIGTGINDRSILFDQAKDWGMLEWITPVLSVMMDGMSDSANYHVAKLLPGNNVGSLDQQRYFRFDICLKNASDDLDDTSRTNINGLLHEADRIIDRQDAELDELIKKLGS